MLLLEVSTIDPGELRRYAEIYRGEAEIFLRDDGKGALVLCNGPVAAGNSEAKSVKKLFDGGGFGKSGGDWLFCVALWTPDDYRDEFLAWYQTEHLPILLECPAWDGCRFLEEKVSDKKALDSQERKRSRSTPWFKRLAKNAWFDGAFQRTLYRRFAQT